MCVLFLFQDIRFLTLLLILLNVSMMMCISFQLYAWDGRLVRQFAKPSDGGQFGDVACCGDNLVTLRVLKQRVVMQVYQLSTGQLQRNLEIGPAGRLRRPAGVVALSDGTAAVVDLVSSCLHKYRFK